MSSPIPPVRVVFQVDGVDAVVAGTKRVQSGLNNSAAAAKNMTAIMAQSTTGARAWAAGLANVEQQGLGFRAGMGENVQQVDKFGAAVDRGIGRLKQLAIAYATTKALAFINDAIDAAASLHELSQQTGATVETLSVLEFAGKRAGVGADDLAVGFKGLALSLAQLRDGGAEAPKVAKAFADIGLAAKDLEGLTVDQTFEKIATALGSLPPGFDRASAAQAIFGRSGAALIPLLDDLATQGFDKTREAAERFNAVITDEAARAADDYKDKLGDLTFALQGFAREAIPPAIHGVEALTELLSRKPGDALQNDLEDLARLADLATGKMFHLQDAVRQWDSRSATSKGDPFGFRGNIGDTSPLIKALGPIKPGAGAATDDEIEALAKIREAGRLTEEQQQRIAEIVRQLNRDYKAQGTTVEQQAKILGQIHDLTKNLKTDKQAITEADRQDAEFMRQQAQEAEKVLRAESARRTAEQDRKRTEGFADALRQTGGFGSFEDLIKKQQSVQVPVVGNLTPTLNDDIIRQHAEALAEAAKEAMGLRDAEMGAINANELLGASMRDAVAGEIANFLTGLDRLGTTTVTIEPELDSLGHVVKDEFGNTIEKATKDVYTLGDAFADLARSVVRSIQQIVAQLLAARLVSSIAGALFGGIAAAPAGGNLGGQDLGDLAGSAPTFATGGYTGPGGKYQPAGVVHAGEFVFDADTTRKNLPLFQAIHTFGAESVLPGYEEGGPVLEPVAVRSFAHLRGYATGGLVEGGSGGDLGTATIGLEEGLILKHLDSAFLKVAAKHRRSLRDITGK